MAIKGPCTWLLSSLPAGLGQPPLTAPSRLMTWSCTGQGLSPPAHPPPSLFSYGHHLHFAREPCGSCGPAGRFPSGGEEGLETAPDMIDLASPSNCARGKPREPLDIRGPTIPLLEASPCLGQMAQPASSLQVQQQQARTLQTLGRHLASIPKWTFMLWLTACADNPAGASPGGSHCHPQRHSALLVGDAAAPR